MANVARARESGLRRTVRMHDADYANLPKHNLPDPKMLQDPRKGAIRAGDPDMRHHPGDILGLGKDADREREIDQRIVIKQSNAAQKSKNQIPHVIPPYHTTPKKNQNNQNTGSIPVNIPHWR